MKTIFLVLAILTSQLALAQGEFVTRWNLSEAGLNANTIAFEATTTGPVSYAWQEISPGTASGLGQFGAGVVSIGSLPVGATIELRISPANFQQFKVSFDDRFRLVNVTQWGTALWTSMNAAFSGCSNLEISASDVPELSEATDLGGMFEGCSSLNGPENIGEWNVSTITQMYSMFRGAATFNQPLGLWNTGAVIDMSGMFAAATAFDQPIGTWNTGNVENMNGMFEGATSFNQSLNWNTSSVEDMSYMFSGASDFNGSIGTWNTENVQNMSHMFEYASAFNQPIGSWKTLNVTTMFQMFSYATDFNQPIGTWNTGNVTDMSRMFMGAEKFDQPIGAWNTGNVGYMSRMFEEATAFNQPIGGWDTGNVELMGSMFEDATSFNQPIGSWTTSNVTDMSDMFYRASAFDQPIGTWNTGNVESMDSMFKGAALFNQPLNTWNTVNVTNMEEMFYEAYLFNQPLGNWDVQKVEDMVSMFESATSFDRSLGNWTLNPSVEMDCFFSGSGLSCFNYSETLKGWSANPATPAGIYMDAEGITYSPGASEARAILTGKGWTISDDGPSEVECLDPLPVTLVSFSGEKDKENRTLLKWATVAEKDFDRFEVQRSSHARSFEKIGVVKGKTATTMPAHTAAAYEFTDRSGAGSNYYRLKMVDLDGSFEYSRIVWIQNAVERAVVGSFYPNPSRGDVRVGVDAVESGRWIVTVFDATGRSIATRVYQLQKGANTIRIESISNGLHLVRFEHDGFSEVMRLIIE